jgi:hypothetical protein
MTQQHPITPSPELIEDWIEIAKPEPWKRPPDPNVLCTLAAQWGADQELEACCRQLTDPEWYDEIKNLRGPFRAAELRAARRPKPPSLKEQALLALNDAVKMADDAPPEGICSDQANIIRRALEQLNA